MGLIAAFPPSQGQIQILLCCRNSTYKVIIPRIIVKVIRKRLLGQIPGNVGQLLMKKQLI